MIDRRGFAKVFVAGAAAAAIRPGNARGASAPKIRNVVMVHGLFADGSCWSEVIRRLQPRRLNVTSVQNPLTTLPESVDETAVKAEYKDGVLNLHLPKSERVKPKAIDVKVA